MFAFQYIIGHSTGVWARVGSETSCIDSGAGATKNLCGVPSAENTVRDIWSSHKEVTDIKIEMANEIRQIMTAQ